MSLLLQREAEVAGPETSFSDSAPRKAAMLNREAYTTFGSVPDHSALIETHKYFFFNKLEMQQNFVPNMVLTAVRLALAPEATPKLSVYT
jgi:hypothetical protein